ncbi:MAG TPA: FecR family protein [Pyrinomonadaceae bacterium]
MKSGSRHTLSLVGLALSLAFGMAASARAQNREKYIISATAGGINYVSGNVTVQRKGVGRERELTSSDDLKTGDKVTTAAGGRVEVLLNPGSYLRVDENSEFELANASLDNLLVRLLKGSAVVEATGGDGIKLAIGINTPQTEAVIIKGGIYRFNVRPDETTEILVRKGRLILVKGATTEIKGGQKVLVGRGILEVAKLNKKEQDSLDLWSKDRAELLARANRRLQTRPLLTAFNDFDWNSFNGWSWANSRRDTQGLWVYDPGTRSHCFLPVGSRSGSSPYGHSYGRGINYNGNGNNWPQGGDGPQVTGNGSSGSGSTGSSGGNGNGNGNSNPTPSQSAPPPQPTPPPQASPPPAPADTGIERGPRRDYTTQSPN